MLQVDSERVLQIRSQQCLELLLSVQHAAVCTPSSRSLVNSSAPISVLLDAFELTRTPQCEILCGLCKVGTEVPPE